MEGSDAVKRIVSILAVLAIVLCLCGCKAKLTDEEALEKAQELYSKAEDVCLRDGFEYETYDTGLEKKFELDGVYYNNVTNFYELVSDAFSGDAILQLKKDLTLLLTEDGGAYIEVKDKTIPQLYDHTELSLKENHGDYAVFTATSYTFASLDEQRAKSEPSVVTEAEFKIELSKHTVTDANGKESAEQYWRISEFFAPTK